MKKCICLMVMFFSFGSVFSQDIVEGYWKSFDKNTVSGYWIVYEENDLLFATCLLATGLPVDATCEKCTRNYKGHPMMGKQFPNLFRAQVPLVYNLRKVSPGVWENGHIIDARNGKVYTCEISYKKADGKKFKEDCLAVRGEIALGLGMTIYWKKASAAEINAAIKDTAENYGGDYARAHLDEFLIAE